MPKYRVPPAEFMNADTYFLASTVRDHGAWVTKIKVRNAPNDHKLMPELPRHLLEFNVKALLDAPLPPQQYVAVEALRCMNWTPNSIATAAIAGRNATPFQGPHAELQLLRCVSYCCTVSAELRSDAATLLVEQVVVGTA